MLWQVLFVQNFDKSRDGNAIKSLMNGGSMEEVLALESKEVQLVLDRRPKIDGLFYFLFPDHPQS